MLRLCNRFLKTTVLCISSHRVYTGLGKRTNLYLSLPSSAQNILEHFCGLGQSSDEAVFVHETSHCLHRVSLSLQKPGLFLQKLIRTRPLRSTLSPSVQILDIRVP